MRVHFLSPTPRFGRKSNRLPLGYQQRSPYYWWWECLRRNDKYLSCCKKKGAGELAALYEDFGDVRDGDFHKWWTENQRGVYLFGEQPLSIRFGELTNPSDWNPHWSAEEVIVVAIPLRLSKRELKGRFSKLLDSRHTGKVGRISRSVQNGTARYLASRNYTIQNLSTAIDAYDRWVRNAELPKSERQTLWELGKDMNLNRKACKLAESKKPDERLEGRNTLAVTFSRYVSQAKKMIDGVEKGVFPA